MLGSHNKNNKLKMLFCALVMVGQGVVGLPMQPTPRSSTSSRTAQPGDADAALQWALQQSRQEHQHQLQRQQPQDHELMEQARRASLLTVNPSHAAKDDDTLQKAIHSSKQEAQRQKEQNQLQAILEQSQVDYIQQQSHQEALDEQRLRATLEWSALEAALRNSMMGMDVDWDEVLFQSILDEVLRRSRLEGLNAREQAELGEHLMLAAFKGEEKEANEANAKEEHGYGKDEDNWWTGGESMAASFMPVTQDTPDSLIDAVEESKPVETNETKDPFQWLAQEELVPPLKEPEQNNPFADGNPFSGEHEAVLPSDSESQELDYNSPLVQRQVGSIQTGYAESVQDEEPASQVDKSSFADYPDTSIQENVFDTPAPISGDFVENEIVETGYDSFQPDGDRNSENEEVVNEPEVVVPVDDELTIDNVPSLVETSKISELNQDGGVEQEPAEVPSLLVETEFSEDGGLAVPTDMDEKEQDHQQSQDQLDINAGVTTDADQFNRVWPEQDSHSAEEIIRPEPQKAVNFAETEPPSLPSFESDRSFENNESAIQEPIFSDEDSFPGTQMDKASYELPSVSWTRRSPAHRYRFGSDSSENELENVKLRHVEPRPANVGRVVDDDRVAVDGSRPSVSDLIAKFEAFGKKQVH